MAVGPRRHSVAHARPAGHAAGGHRLAPAKTPAVANHPAVICFILVTWWAEADNNLAENALRTVSLVQKNYLFFGSDHGGDRGAQLYGLIGSGRLSGIDPESYLRHVLSVIADWPVNRVGELLPWRVTLRGIISGSSCQYGSRCTLTRDPLAQDLNQLILALKPHHTWVPAFTV